jgi:hypothetical protein
MSDLVPFPVSLNLPAEFLGHYSYASLLCLSFFLRVSSVPIPTAPDIIIGRGTLKANACVEQSGWAPSELS